jgi:glycerophosphoryl diester phosphodiesterase
MTSSKTLIVAGATGYGAYAPNSLEGTLACLADPVDGIEIDVQMTSDGHVIAHHDYWLSVDSSRLDGAWITDRGAPLKTLQLAELQRYDIGRLRPGSDYDLRYTKRTPNDGARIPTLPALLEALNRAEGPRRLIYVEIKTDPTHPESSPAADVVTNAVIDDLIAADYLAHAKIIAFDWSVLRLATARVPDIATAHLTIPAPLAQSVERPADRDSPWNDGSDPRHFGGSELRAIKAHGGMEWSPYYTDVNEERVREAAELGLKVGPWGLSKSEDIQRMISLGVFSATVAGPAWS